MCSRHCCLLIALSNQRQVAHVHLHKLPRRARNAIDAREVAGAVGKLVRLERREQPIGRDRDDAALAGLGPMAVAPRDDVNLPSLDVDVLSSPPERYLFPAAGIAVLAKIKKFSQFADAAEPA